MTTPFINHIKADSPEQMGDWVASQILTLVQEKPSASLALPTGNTPLPVYEVLRKKAVIPQVWKSVHFFQLDEYCLPASGKMPISKQSGLRVETFQDYLQREVLSELGGIFHGMHGFQSHPEDYEDEILRAGGLDLVLLGIGKNGHIAFNEPGSSVNSITRYVLLSQSTLLANFGQQDNYSVYPTHAISMGIATIMAARQVILMATGTSKQAIIHKAFYSKKPSKDCPASWLINHSNFTLVTDF